VANALRLLKLAANIQKSLEQEEISPGHARALLAVNGKKEREKLFQEITARGLSVREAEKRAAALNNAPPDGEIAAKSKPTPRRDPELDAIQEKFIGRLGTKVVIDGDYTKGRILIDYYSMEDLERLYDIIGGK
jgi:ParB family chromosome partitioning protein